MEILNFVEFIDSWWSSLIFLNVLMNLELWNSMLIKKSQFDFLCISWLFISWSNFNYQSIDLEKWFEPWNYLKILCWIIEIMLEAIRSCTRSKVTDQSFSVKTLILTILPFRQFDHFSWGIVIQIWSIDAYEFKRLILV